MKMIIADNGTMLHSPDTHCGTHELVFSVNSQNSIIGLPTYSKLLHLRHHKD